MSLAAGAAVISGLSALVYDSSLAPLIVLAAALVTAFGVVSLRVPVLPLYAVLVVTLLPFGLIPASLHSILNRSLTLVALGVWALDMIHRRSRVIWPSTMWPLSGFVVWSLLTLLWAPSFTVGWDTLVKYALRSVLFLFLLTNEISTWKNLRRLMIGLAFLGWVFVVVSVGTVVTEGYVPGTRLQVLGGNENTAGDLLPVGLIGVLWLATERPNSRKVFLGTVYVLLSFVLIALSGSRGGAITWTIIMVSLLFWRRTRRWGIIGLLILALAVFTGSAILIITIDRFTGEAGFSLLGGREALWRGAVLLIRDHPWLGVGIGNASHEVVPYARLFRSLLGLESASLHNPVLVVWAETGIVGLGLYLLVLASSVLSFVQECLKARRLGSEQLSSYFALVGSAFMGHMASWIKGGGAESSYSYFLLLGLLLVPSCLRSEVHTDPLVFPSTHSSLDARGLETVIRNGS